MKRIRSTPSNIQQTSGSLLRFRRRHLLAAAAAAVFLINTQTSQAAGPISVANVAAGSAQFSHSGATTIIHASNNAIINYRQFNIPAGQAVDFVQPTASSRVLNRVITNVPSQIDGALRANGVVYLVNPAGVIFGPHSVVNVGDLYAAAGHLSNANFLHGVDHFTDLSGTLANIGKINAGAVSLLGADVINSGSINAPKGSIVLASAKDVYLTRIGGLITAKLSDAAAEPSLRATVSSAQADRAAIHAVTQRDQLVCAGSALALGIMNSGTLHAAEIRIQAAGTKSVAVVSGHISASTIAAGKRGGDISIQAGHIAIGFKPNMTGALSAAPTQITADGPSGGGNILIGAAPSTTAADGYRDAALTTRISGETIIDASATVAGSGGFIDTSGHALSIAPGVVISSGGAGEGHAGLWQLDPVNLLISSSQPNSGSYTALTATGTNPLTYSTPHSTGSYWVNVGTIDTALAGNSQHAKSGVDVSVTASGLLELGSPIDPAIVSTNAETLTLTGESLQINNAIDPSGNSSTLSVILNSTAGPINVNAGLGLSSNPLEAVTINADGGSAVISLASSVYTSGGGQFYEGSLNLGPGSITLNEETATTPSGNITLGSSGGYLTNSYNNQTGNATTLNVDSSGGYIADNVSITPSGASQINLSLSAGGSTSAGQAIAITAPIQTDGGYFTASSTGSGSLSVTGIAGTASTTAMINTGGGNATFSVNGGSVTLTGGQGGTVAGGDAVDTGTGSLVINASAVTIKGGAGGAATTANGSAGGVGASVGGAITIGSPTPSGGVINIIGGAGGNGLIGFTGGAGGAGISDAGGAITLYFSANSSITGGANGSSSGGSGGVAIGTSASNLQFKPWGTANPQFIFNNFPSAPAPTFSTTGDFIFGTGGTLELYDSISTSGSMSLGTVTLGANTTLTDSGSAGTGIAVGAVTGGDHNLTLNESDTSQNINLTGNISGVAALDVTGPAVMGAGVSSITTTGGQTYGAVTLGASTTLADSGSAGTGIAVGAVTGGGYNLTLEESGASQNINLTGNISGVAALDVTGPAVMGAGVNSITTTGGQTYGAVTLGASTTLADSGSAGTGIAVGAVTGGDHNLTLEESGASQNINLTGNISGVAALDVTGPAVMGAGVSSITTTGGQTYASSLQMDSAAVALSDHSSAGIAISQIVDSASAKLTINEAGTGTVTLPTTTPSLASNSTALKSLSVQGGTIFAGDGTIVTTAGQTFDSPMDIAAGQTVTLQDTSTDGIQLHAINGATNSALIVNEGGSGAIDLNNTIGAFTGFMPQQPTLGSLSVTNAQGQIGIGTTLINVGQISLSSGDAVVPISNATLGTVTVYSPSQSYTASGSTSTASLDFKTDKIELFGANSLTPANSISLTQYNSLSDADLPVYSTDALSLESTGGNIILNGGSDVPNTTALTLTSDSGYVTLGSTNAVSVKSLAVNAATAINIDNSISTTHGQTYAGASANSHPEINLPASGQITLTDEGSTGSTGINILGPLTGISESLSLVQHGGGIDVNLGSPGQSIQVKSLAVTDPATINLNGGTIETTAGQTYTGPVTLSQDVSLNGGSGTVTLNNAVATDSYNFAVAAGTINLRGGSVTGTGNQTYTGTINVNNNTTLTGAAMAFIGTLKTTDSSTLSVNATGSVNFSGGAQQLTSGGLAALTVQAGEAITLGGNLSAQSIALTSSDGAAGAITTGGSSPFIIAANSQSYTATGIGGAIALHQSLFAQFTGYPAVVSTSSFPDINKLPTEFSVSQASPITDSNLPALNQFVTVTSSLFIPESVIPSTSLNQMPYSITYSGTPQSANPVIALTGQNDLTGADLTLSAPNSAMVLGLSGKDITLGSLSINGIVNILGGIITSGTSSNSQSYTGTLVLSGGSVLLENTGSGNINISANVTPDTSSALTITDTGGGAINLLNAIGSASTPLGSLMVNVSNGSILNIDGGSILTAKGQTYNGSVAIGGNTTLTDEGSTPTGINILGPLTGTGDSLSLVQHGSGIDVTLGSPGQSIQVKSLAVTTDPATINLNGGTIETTAGQTYTGTLDVLAPTTLQDTSSGTLSFQGITGPSILTVSAPTDLVDLTTGINPGGIRITGQSITLPIGDAISTSVGQVLNGSTITLIGNTTLSDSGAAGSAGIQLAGDIKEPAASLTLNQGGGVDGVIGNGPASLFNLGGLTIGHGTFLSQLGTLTLGSAINNDGDISLLSSLLFTNSSGPLTLAGKIDLQNGSTLTAEPFGGTTVSDVISNATIGSIADTGNVTIEGDNVTVNGTIRASGQVLLQDNNQLMIGPFGTANFDYRPTSLLAINNSISGGTILINPMSPVVPGIGVAVPDAATIVSTGARAVSITGGVVTMGRDQKWTSLGSLAITGSTVNLGDLNVLGNLTVKAPTINMLTRGFGSLLTSRGLHANSKSKPDGVDVIAGNIEFSSMPIPLPAAVPGGPPYPQFATPSGGGSVPGYPIHVFNAGAGGLTAADLYSTVLSPGITPTQKFYLDLQASGPVTTNVFDSFTTFAIPHIPQVRTTISLSASQRAVLQAAGINAKNPTLTDLLALSDGQAVFNDIPRSNGLIMENPSLIDYYVTTARLPFHRTLAFIALYKRVFLVPVLNPKSGQAVKGHGGLPEYRSLRSTMHSQFRAAWARYAAAMRKTEHGQVSSNGFRAYVLHSPCTKAAAADLRNLSKLLYQAYLLGLSPKALRLSTSTILAELSPEALSNHQFERVVLGPKIGFLAAHGSP